MKYPAFTPTVPKGCTAVVVHVSWIRTGTLVTYEVRDARGCREQRTAFTDETDPFGDWDMINWKRAKQSRVMLRKSERVYLKGDCWCDDYIMPASYPHRSTCKRR